MRLALPLPLLLLVLGATASHVRGGIVYDLSFDGGDRVTIPNSSSLNPSAITIETQVNFGRIAFGNGYSGTDCQYMIAKGGERHDGMYGLYSGWGNPATRTTTRLGFSIEDWGGKGHLQKYITPETDRWYHVAGTYDGNIMRLYLDGILLGQRSVGSYTLGNSYPLYLGYMDTYRYPYYLTGLMDEVRIWDDARTPEQINETMNVALTGNENGLMGLWNFDAGPNNQTVLDSTPNGNHGYLGYATYSDYRDPQRIVGVNTVPEPSAIAVWATLGGMVLFAARRKRKAT